MRMSVTSEHKHRCQEGAIGEPKNLDDPDIDEVSLSQDQIADEFLNSAPTFDFPKENKGCLPRVVRIFLPYLAEDQVAHRFWVQKETAQNWFNQTRLSLVEYPVATLVETYGYVVFYNQEPSLQKKLWLLSVIWFAIMERVNLTDEALTIEQKKLFNTFTSLLEVDGLPNFSRQQQQIYVTLQAAQIRPSLGGQVSVQFLKEDVLVTAPETVAANRDYLALLEVLNISCIDFINTRPDQNLPLGDQLTSILKIIRQWLAADVDVFKSYQGSMSSYTVDTDSRRKKYIPQVQWILALEVCATVMAHSEITTKDWTSEAKSELKNLVEVLIKQLNILLGYANQTNVVAQFHLDSLSNQTQSPPISNPNQLYKCEDDINLNITPEMVRFLQIMTQSINLTVGQILRGDPCLNGWRTLYEKINNP